MRRVCRAGIDQQRRPPALAPAGAILRVEPHGGCPVAIDTVGLADYDAAIGTIHGEVVASVLSAKHNATEVSGSHRTAPRTRPAAAALKRPLNINVDARADCGARD